MKRIVVVVVLLMFLSVNAGAVGLITVEVRSDWTLWDIAQDCNLDVERLMQINDLEDTTIHPGQKLKVEGYDNSTVTVSWYGEEFHGDAMSNGQVFDMEDKTVAAHKWLPFGTKVRLTRIDTNRSIIVTIQDRGPYVEGRNFDLSKGAARKLNMLGEGVVECTATILS